MFGKDTLNGGKITVSGKVLGLNHITHGQSLANMLGDYQHLIWRIFPRLKIL